MPAPPLATRLCPFSAELTEVVRAADEHSELARHVDGCPACQRRLEELSGKNGDWARFDATSASSVGETGSALLQVLEAARSYTRFCELVPQNQLETAGLLDPAADVDELGRLGPYAITGVLGRGGMGVVFQGRDLVLNRLVAIKIMSPQLAASPQGRLRFAREARAAAAIDHDHVVAIHAVEEARGIPYLVMQHVAGASLQERLDRHEPFSIAQIVRMGMQIAAGLAAAHARGLVHRDIKPANILLEQGSQRVKLTDFGLARAVDEASQTQSGVIAGTPPYMAPEQARADPVDHRSDLFSLGSVLYALCTGHHPFEAGTALATLRLVCDEDARPVQEFNRDVPDWLAEIIAVLHAKRPEDRLQSAAEVADLLQQGLTHLECPQAVGPPVVPGANLRITPDQDSPRRRAWTQSKVLLLFLLLALTAGAALPLSRALIGRWLVWDSSTPAGKARVAVRLRAALENIPGPVLTATFAPGSELLATGGEDRGIHLWDLATKDERALLQGHSQRVWSVAIAPNGSMLASGSGEWHQQGLPGELKIWDIASRSEWFDLKGHSDLIFSVAFSPNSRMLASGSRDRSIKLWDASNGKELRTLTGHQAAVRFVAFSPDGKFLASGGFDDTVRLWDLTTGKERAALPCGGHEVNCLAFSPDGKTLAAAVNPKWNRSAGQSDPPGYIVLWDLAKRTRRAVLHGHQGMILSLAFSPNGLFLVSGGGDYGRLGEVKLWDLQRQKAQLDLHGHHNWVECVAFSPDGSTLVTAGGIVGRQGEVRLWDTALASMDREKD